MKITLVPEGNSLAKILDGACIDITGEIFDWGIAFSCHSTLEQCQDFYDKVMFLFGCNVQLTKLVPNWYSQTTIENFIINHRKVFEKFMEKTYEEEYIYDWSTIKNDSEEFYDVFLNLMENLICGNCCEEDYEILWNLFMEEK